MFYYVYRSIAHLINALVAHKSSGNEVGMSTTLKVDFHLFQMKCVCAVIVSYEI